MSNFSFGLMAERAGIPVDTDFIQSWALLAQKSGYCRHRLAKIVQVSTRTLDRYFERHLSLSAQEWLSELQLVDAYDQVMTGKPIKEISFDAGFKQPSHFTKRFKARFGIPPSLLLGRGACAVAKPCRGFVACLRGDAAADDHNDGTAHSYAE